MQQQPRVEPHVGTSRSWDALNTDMDPSQQDLETSESAVFAHHAGSEDFHTVGLEDGAEQTLHIPVMSLATSQLGNTPITSSDATAQREVQVGTVLRERYVLHRLLGTGGTCRVFLAEDLHRRLSTDASGELIALKVLRPELRHSQHSLQRLRREFLQMQQLTHPAITRVFDLDRDGDVWFMTMELVDAPNALGWMRREYSNGAALHLILACCEAVAYAHRKGVVHGDLKPGNVLVLGHAQVKLIDFGVVSTRDEHAVVTKVEATPQYASPAVLAGNRAEARDDIFALGCLAYMILARGRHPFERKPSTEAARTQLRAPYIPGIPLRLFEVVARALSWDPAQRQASVRELQHALLATEQPRAASLAGATSTAATVPVYTPAAASPPSPDHTLAQPDIPPPEPGHPEQPDPPGDYSYLHKFRGYVAGPMMDVKPRSEAQDEPPSQTSASLVEQALPLDSPAAAVDPPQLYMSAAPVAALEPGITAQQQSPSSSARTLVNVLGASLVLISAVSAALLSRPRHPQTRLLQPAPLHLELPVLTVPTPLIEPLPLPVISIASTQRDSEASSKTEKSARRRPVSTLEKSAAPTASPVSFASRGIEVSPNQKLVAIAIRRASPSRGALRVAWSIVGDRGQLLDTTRTGAQMIRFHEGQAARTLYVPLRKQAAELVADGLRSFRVKLRAVNVDNGEEPEIRVTLMD